MRKPKRQPRRPKDARKKIAAYLRMLGIPAGAKQPVRQA